LRVASWSYDDGDTVALADYLVELGALDPAVGGQQRRLLAGAHIIFEEATFKRAASTQVFVAMRFNDEMSAIYDNGFVPAISNAGYNPVRIDRKDHDGKIDDAIIAELRLSAFVVADFTYHRGGVYYEAGFAHGLGKRVIFTCREDDLENLHFDVRQYNTIPWKVSGDLIAPLQNRILAIFGAGAGKPDARPI
jgi:hypothetical protein